MRPVRLILPPLVFAAIAGFIAFHMTQEARPAEAAGAALSLPTATCAASSNTASVSFSWAPFAGETQWLDVSTTESFAPGTFSGHGPMSNDVTSFKLDNLQANTAQFWRINTPAGKTLKVKISGGTGDADLYVRFSAHPTTSSYACRPYLNGNNETCTLSTTSAGDYYVMLRGYTPYSGVSLVASF